MMAELRANTPLKTLGHLLDICLEIRNKGLLEYFGQEVWDLADVILHNDDVIETMWLWTLALKPGPCFCFVDAWYAVNR